MRILVACEESQSVVKLLRTYGHEAYSCDIQDCSGSYPNWHLKIDLKEALKLKWDMIIAFPPCTHLATSGARHFEKKREDGRQAEGIKFFAMILNHSCPKIAIENPVGIISGKYIKKHFPDLSEKYGLPIKPSQIIQPWQFGDEAQKTTCLWLKGLPLLKPTKIVGKGDFWVSPNGKKRMPKWFSDNKCSKIRSKTFPGIAEAMAKQWIIDNELANL